MDGFLPITEHKEKECKNRRSMPKIKDVKPILILSHDAVSLRQQLS
jgi:hypothetical protein